MKGLPLQIQIELVVLLSVVGLMLLTVWLERRFPTQSWIENRLAWLCPRDLVIAGEALAQARPYRYMSGTFFFLLGFYTLITDLTPAFGSSVTGYGGSACVAVFALYTTRMNARRRAEQTGAA